MTFSRFPRLSSSGCQQPHKPGSGGLQFPRVRFLVFIDSFRDTEILGEEKGVANGLACYHIGPGEFHSIEGSCRNAHCFKAIKSEAGGVWKLDGTIIWK